MPGSIFPWLAMVVAIAVNPALDPPPDPSQCREQSFYVMGTVARIEACGLTEPVLDEAIARAYRELESVDRLMSLYREDSELCRLNRQPPNTPIRLSDSTYEVLGEAIRVANGSGGSFDPTIGPVVRLWGFYRGEGSVPAPTKLANARAKLGFRKIRLDSTIPSVELAADGVEIDLGGLAKGYAVDKALARLKAAGASEAIVDLGESSLALFGYSSKNTIFSIRTNPSVAFELEEGCVSTSAADEQGFEEDGVWLSHIIDPRTGWPVKDSVSATVVGKDGQAMLVDALSTAGFVAGPDGALDLWKRFGVEGILFYRRNGRIEFVHTPGFPLTQAASLR
jgi:thiamine biosynthesis lipoprotein